MINHARQDIYLVDGKSSSIRPVLLPGQPSEPVRFFLLFRPLEASQVHVHASQGVRNHLLPRHAGNDPLSGAGACILARSRIPASVFGHCAVFVVRVVQPVVHSVRAEICVWFLFRIAWIVGGW